MAKTLIEQIKSTAGKLHDISIDPIDVVGYIGKTYGTHKISILNSAEVYKLVYFLRQQEVTAECVAQRVSELISKKIERSMVYCIEKNIRDKYRTAMRAIQREKGLKDAMGRVKAEEERKKAQQNKKNWNQIEKEFGKMVRIAKQGVYNGRDIANMKFIICGKIYQITEIGVVQKPERRNAYGGTKISELE